MKTEKWKLECQRQKTKAETDRLKHKESLQNLCSACIKGQEDFPFSLQRSLKLQLKELSRVVSSFIKPQCLKSTAEPSTIHFKEPSSYFTSYFIQEGVSNSIDSLPLYQPTACSCSNSQQFIVLNATYMITSSWVGGICVHALQPTHGPQGHSTGS